MMNTIKALTRSKKAMVLAGVTACGALLVLTGKMALGDWLTQTKWLSMAYLGAQGVQDGLATRK